MIPISAKADEKTDGHWEGNVSVMGTELNILVDIKSDSNNKLTATINVPQQGLKDISLENIIYNNPKIHLELPTPNGKALLDGTVGDNKITGNFEQNGIGGKFDINKKASSNLDSSHAKSLEYREENISYKNGSNTIAGTLTLPIQKGNYPAVILITGSGAQNRDEEIFGFKIFKLIAEDLTKKGIAVLRCDDRGVGQSIGGTIANSTTADLSEDTNLAVKFLLNHSEINKNKIGLFGHSEGGIIGPMVAQKNKNVSFIVLMAGTAETGEKIIFEQSQLIQKVMLVKQADIDKSIKFQEKIFKAIKTNQGWENIKKDLKKQAGDNYDLLSDTYKQSFKNKNTYIDVYVKSTLENLNTKWFKYFLEYDPIDVLNKTTVPTLALFGTKDLQVPASTNAPLMEKALKKAVNKNYTIKIMDNANHLFQSANTGSPSEYASLEKKFVPEFLDLVSDWIITNTK